MYLISLVIVITTDNATHEYSPNRQYWSQAASNITTTGAYSCTYGELTIDSDAACTESGHDWQESGRVEATCQQVAGIIYTCTICGENKTIFGDGEFSEWSETYPEGIDDELIETAIQYRYRDKETITSSEPVVEGYELVDTMWQEGFLSDSIICNNHSINRILFASHAEYNKKRK